MKEQRSISLHGTPFTYLLSHSTRARRLRISVSDAGVTLVLPAGISTGEGESFLLKNSEWVLQQLEQRQRHQAKNTRPPLPEDVILLRGRPTRVELIEEQERRVRARLEEKHDRLLVYLPAGKSSSSPQMIEHWLRELARTEIEAAVKVQARRMHASPQRVTIRDQRTRWGSCTSQGTLSFNWRLIMVPSNVMEYVVIHELAHLSVPNHSADFWQVVSLFYPAHKEARAWLRKNTPLLHPTFLKNN
jgi:hypothetical protein